MARSASDLLDDPAFIEDSTSAKVPPVSKAISFLSVTDGDLLEILTRTNRSIVAAIDSGSVYVYRYKSAYILSRIQQIERLAISTGGLGRSELIEAVRAGGSMPDSFYESNPRPSDYPLDGGIDGD